MNERVPLLEEKESSETQANCLKGLFCCWRVNLKLD